MAKTPEGSVKAMVNAVVQNQSDIYHFMPVQMGYGKAGLDYHCGIKFRTSMLAFFIEAKKNDGKPTQRQLDLRKELRAKGAKVFVIYNFGGVEELKEWITRVRSSQ